jgi:hypothetical protein
MGYQMKRTTRKPSVKPAAKCTNCTCESKLPVPEPQQPVGISIIVAKEAIDARMRAIQTLADAFVKLASALEAPAVSLNNCTVVGCGNGFSIKSE